LKEGAMSELTAIDILIHPDDAMLARARAVNQRMLQSVPPPQGFALDEHHQPHITVLQRYVGTGGLDAVYEAIDAVVPAVDLAALEFTAVRSATWRSAHPGSD
jgi:hypothetical protein